MAATPHRPEPEDDTERASSRGQRSQDSDWLAAFPTNREELRALLPPEDSVPGLYPLSEGKCLGGFRLIRMLGRGAMGQVWEAEEVALGRLVALKLIHPERVNARNLEFFAREARAGGRLSHPGVVRVHGFGAADGVHWINQELVGTGWTLRDEIEQRRKGGKQAEPSYDEVATLAAELAEALQAAHDAGVIHRDIKPQNILFDSASRPRLTDFGLARIADETALSQTGDVVGTYYYMSPEQIRPSDARIDHRSDIFSLGVVLYELLTLQRPFEGDTLIQITEKIEVWDPPSPRKLRSRLPEQLAVITCKAIEKRPADRYQSMAELASDLRRFLANDSILAKPPGLARRAHKWGLRHPTMSTAAALLLLATTALGGMLVRYVDKSVELGAERDKVAAESERLRDVLGFQEGLFEDLDPAVFGAEIRAGVLDALAGMGMGQDLPDPTSQGALAEVRPWIDAINFTDIGVEAISASILTPAIQDSLTRFEDDPLTAATLRSSLASTSLSLGLQQRALDLAEQALAIRRQQLGDGNADTLTSISAMGSILMAMGRRSEARAYFEEALVGRQQTFGEGHADTLTSLNLLGVLLESTGDLDAAMPLYREAMDSRRALLGDEHLDTLSSIGNMGCLLMSMDRYDEALPYFEESLATYRRVYGEDDLGTIQSLYYMGTLLRLMGRLDDAVPYHRAVLEGRRRLLGSDHPSTLIGLGDLGYLLCSMGELKLGIPYSEEALSRSRRVLGDRHPETLICFADMGKAMWSLGDYGAAAEHFELHVSGCETTFGATHFETLGAIDWLALVYLRDHRAAAARELLERALHRTRADHGESHECSITLRERLIECYCMLHDQNPEGGFDELVEGLKRAQPED